MSNIVLLLNILLVTTFVMDAMDDPAAKKKPAPHLRLSRMDSKKKLAETPQISRPTIQNDYSQLPAISITDPINTDPIDQDLQKTLSQLLDLDSQDISVKLSRNRMVPVNKRMDIAEKNLREPLLPKKEPKANLKKLPLVLDKTASFSSGDSPTTSPSTSPRISPHKKSSFLRKGSSSSSYNSPRDSSGSLDSSPRKLVTYEDVINALNSKSKKIQKLVARFLENPDSDPNQQDKTTGLTILHRVVLLHHKATHLLLCDPRTDTFIEDNNAHKASDFIKDEIIKYENLLNALKIREFIDLIVNGLIITNEEMQDPCYSKAFTQQIIISFLGKILPETLPTYADSNFFIDVISHRKKHTLPLLQEFCKQFKTNPNYQDKYGNTMWHYAAICLNESLIKTLVCNPHLDSSIRNKENNLAAQLILSTNHIKTKNLIPEIIQKIQDLKDLRTLFFTREVLELSSSKQAEALKSLSYSSDTHSLPIEISPEDLLKAKTLMIKDFNAMANNQGDSSLPETTAFPKYATDDFIDIIFKRNVAKIEAQQKILIEPIYQQHLKSLLEVLAKESELILNGKIQLKHIVFSKPEPKKDQDVIEQDPLVSKSSED